MADKITTLKDSLTYEWLYKCIVYLESTSNSGFPEKMEKTRNEMIAALREWTENIMSNIKIENYSRKLKIVDTGANNVLITWSKYGLLNYSLTGNNTSTNIGPYYIGLSNGFKIEATPFDQNINTPSDISERYDILKQERLKANINTIYEYLNTHITKAYVQDTLLGNRSMKLKKPDTLRKKIKALRELLDNMDCCFNRVEDAKKYVFNKLYDPAAMEPYIKDCISLSDAFYNMIHKNYADIASKIENNEKHVMYNVKNLVDKLVKNTKDNGIPTNTLEMIDYALPDSNYYYRSVLIPGLQCDVNSYYSDLEEYYSTEEKVLFKKYLDKNKSVNKDALPEVIKTNVLKELAQAYPEILNKQTERYRDTYSSPMQNAIDEYDKLNNEYEKFINQFIVSVTGEWNSQKRNYEYERKFILPDEELTQIIFELCTDLDDKKKESLNGFYAYKNDFKNTFDQRPSVLKISDKLALNCDKIYNANETEQNTLNIFNRYDHYSYNNYGSTPLDLFWQRTIPKLMKDYVKKGKLNTSLYKKLITEFIDEKFPKEIDDPKTLNYNSVYLVPKDNKYYDIAKKMLYRLIDKMNDSIDFISKGILTSNDIHFLNWCMREKLIDKNLAEQRIKELENAIPVTETT